MIGKTQVLVATINDHHRTRLTHTLEVAQIGRTVARRLRLNEDLTEAIALAHDLGHPPFGHAGEDALDECLQDHGGFDHNLHGLRLVDELEDRYPQLPGPESVVGGARGVRPAQQATRCAGVRRVLAAAGEPLLEAQVVDAADSLAYDTHDIDDALGLGFITLDELDGVEFWARCGGTRSPRTRRASRADPFASPWCGS